MASYSATVLDHFYNPRNVGELMDADGWGSDGTPGHGPAMQFWVKLNDTIVEKITFKAYGCGAAIACCSILTEMAAGKDINEASQITPETIASEMGGLPLGKYHCPEMAITALGLAVENAIKHIS